MLRGSGKYLIFLSLVTKIDAQSDLAEQGAIVYFQRHVDQVRLHERPHSYILRNFDSWVDFAIGTCNLDISRDDIMFIQSFVKGSTQWAVAAVTENGRSGQFSMQAGFMSGSGGPSMRWGFHRSDRSTMGLEKRQNPPGFVLGREGNTENEEIPQGQCFFINYFKVRRRLLWRGLKIQAAAEPRDPQCGDGEDNGDQSPNVSRSSTERNGQEELEVVAGPEEIKV